MKMNDYFKAYTNYFWQWEDNAEVIAIPDHSTIAYRAFIKEVLAILSDQGVPPFGALLAAILATNAQGNVALDVLQQKFADEINKEGNAYLVEAFVFLKLLSEMPEEYKKGNKRVLLLQVIFENCHNIFSVKNSREIIRWYDVNKENTALFAEKKELNHTIYSRDFRTISLLGSRFKSVDAIIDKIASIPEVTEVIIPKEETRKGNNKQTFIDELIADNRTFQLGIFAERVLSGLNVPFHRSLADQQPLGGISDVTNKGSFDKLLLSEFANEDILFLSRLANNEALYIEREIPPSNNKLKRVFLIDVSLRNWGTPKLIAFATMLAIAKAPKTATIECSAFCVGRSFKPIVLDNIHALIEGMQILEGSADASSGLSLYFKENPPDKDTELFLLTESSAAKQTAMYNSLGTYGPFINYYIHTDFDGNIDVFKKQQKSQKHIQHIKLPLEELLKKKPATAKLNLRNESVLNYPLLVRNATHIKQQLLAPNGELYQITGEKALVKKYDRFAKHNEKGWVIVHENIPFADGICEIVELNNGEHMLFMFHVQKKIIVLLNIATGDKKTVTFNEFGMNHVYKNFIYIDQSFYHKNNHIWRIGIDGTVELDSYIQEKDLFTIKKPLALVPDKSYTQGIFKNINDVFINENNNLVFNIHELHLKNNSYFKLEKTTHISSTNRSTKTKPNEFVFDDGSCIEVNRSGVLILKSSDENIPLIYIPSIIESALGLAAGNDFSGYEYYYKSPLVELILKKAGQNILPQIQALHEQTDIPRHECGEIMHSRSLPRTIIQYVSMGKAETIRRMLEIHGSTIEIKEMPVKEQKLTIIPPSLFYDKYIQAFVKNIQSYGTKN